ncbi:MAG: DUF4126 domain-containing protein [Gemmatimonadaceae bacterium]|nr:DUF4126 domain-containing protein [Gemmatimonadaceae bacterium]
MIDAVSSLPGWWSAWALPIGAGVCLSAACGFRTFIPLLAVGLASHFGVIPLDAQYGWLATTTGLVALGTAAVLEVGGYYIPMVDHALDVIATPLAAAAGVLVMFTSIGSDHGLLGWLVALMLGGGLSGAVQLTTVKTRALSLGTTAGLGNPVVATGELVGAAGLSALAVLLPVVALLVAVVLLVVLWRVTGWVRRRRSVPSD